MLLMFSEVDEVAARLGQFVYPMRLPLKSGNINIMQGKFLI